MKLIGGNINNLQQINVHFPREKKIRNKNTLNHKYFENFTKFTKDIQNQKKKQIKAVPKQLDSSGYNHYVALNF